MIVVLILLLCLETKKVKKVRGSKHQSFSVESTLKHFEVAQNEVEEQEA